MLRQKKELSCFQCWLLKNYLKGNIIYNNKDKILMIKIIGMKNKNFI